MAHWKKARLGIKLISESEIKNLEKSASHADRYTASNYRLQSVRLGIEMKKKEKQRNQVKSAMEAVGINSAENGSAFDNFPKFLAESLRLVHGKPFKKHLSSTVITSNWSKLEWKLICTQTKIKNQKKNFSCDFSVDLNGCPFLKLIKYQK